MTISWPTLKRLRDGFLAGTAGAADYWRSLDDLAQYDATFAQRIGWKWDFVLEDLRELGWRPPAGNLVDWGCGSGIAHRALLDQFHADESESAAPFPALHLYDRSSLAVQFAGHRAREKYPELTVRTGLPETIDLLLISHVLTEMTPPMIEELVEFAARAQSVIWVEPGTYEASLTLIAIRERLRDRFNLVAPCPHQGRCGILAPGNESHWCHQFANPPAIVFTDGFWAEFSRELEIDLRSLPLSYLVLDRRPVPVRSPHAVRIVGRPDALKAYAEVFACSANCVQHCRLMKREHPQAYRQWKKGRFASRQEWEMEGGRITKVVSQPPGDGAGLDS